jgi:anti-anti-sigma factor
LIPTEPPGKGDAWFLTLSSEAHSDRIVWRAAGRLGAAGAAALLDTIKASPSTGLPLVLDLEGVDYVSGAGVRAIETIAKAAQETGRSLELVNLTEPVRICLELAGPLSSVMCSVAPG